MLVVCERPFGKETDFFAAAAAACLPHEQTKIKNNLNLNCSSVASVPLVSLSPGPVRATKMSSTDLDGSSISDEELRRRLTTEFKVNVGPVTPSTRRVLLKKLAKLEKGRNSSSPDVDTPPPSPSPSPPPSPSTLTRRVVLPRIFTSDASPKQPITRPPIRRTMDTRSRKSTSLQTYSDSESDVDEERNVKLTKMLLSHRPGLYRPAPPTKKASGVKAFFSNLLLKLVPEALTKISFSTTFIYVLLSLIATAFFVYILSTYMWPISIACVAITITSAIYVYYRRTKRAASEEQCLVFELVDKSLELLQSPDEPRSMPVLHIRDTLLSPAERNSAKYRRVWNKVVNHVESSDSRVKVEFIKIDGEDFKSWKWIASNPVANYLMSDNEADSDGAESEKIGGVEWQGQAFGSPIGSTGQNSPARTQGIINAANESIAVASPGSKKEFEAPTRFLKIRNIFEKEGHFLDPSWANKIKNTILEKTAIYVEKNGLSDSHDILHIEIEDNPNEGLVYLKCASIPAATNAFHALHGWWCEKKLVSVKFLREDRYYQRFPQAKKANTPLNKTL